MAMWEDFEIDCTSYLNSKFGAYAYFTHQGGPDSTVPDILVQTNSDKSFYIDAKHSPAQCGQFVLLPNIESGTFEYSKQNVTQINKYAHRIIEYMNDDFDKFRNAGTTGRDIDMPNGSSTFSNWIIQAYQEKDVMFFITNNYTILPVERFQEYFDVSAKYRLNEAAPVLLAKAASPL